MDTTGPAGPPDPADPKADDLVGRRVADRFVIRALLARGAMGRVYEAEQVPLGRRVAIKFLDVRATAENTSDWVERFRREAASLAALTSPHTVRIIDYGWWEGLTYLVMEFVDGIPLSRLLRDGPLVAPRALDIALQICDSLQEAHSRGLIHRDLKPDNVLLTRIPDGREWAKVVDWGLVKDMRADQDSTSTGMLLGTPSYMAPEQIRGEPLDGRIDIYALGVVLFRMLTGKKPFDARSTTAGVLLTHLQEPPSRLNDAHPDGRFPDALDAIIQRALAKRPSDRYATAGDLAKDLELAQRVLGGESTPSSALELSGDLRRSAMSLSLTGSAPQRAGRTWWYAGATVAAILVFGVAAAGAGVLAAMLSHGQRAPEIVEVSGSILTDTTWGADKTWVLTEPVFVEQGTLVIEAGTTVLGREGSALVVTRDAQLRARGRSDAPIVFSSARPEGEREPGDWGGVVLLSTAPINEAVGRIEGLPESDLRGQYGGSDPTASCGVLEYVRIEFAGFEVYANNELNGLTLGGCGSNTIVRNVQVHRTLDDGIELFGGTADLEHIVISQPGDDGLDWDEGWQGRVQFLIVQMGPDRGDNAIEADNNATRPSASPRSAPTISHATLIGNRDQQVSQRALKLRAGTGGVFQNFVVRGFDRELVDIGDVETARVARNGGLRLGPGIVFETGPESGPYPVEQGDADDDGGFDEAAWAQGVVETDPGLDEAVWDTMAPTFTPLGASSAASGASTLPDEEFWDAAAAWLGAIRPGVSHTWLDEWTAFPQH